MTDYLSVVFCRLLLAAVMKDVRKVTTPGQRKACWVYNYRDGHWEFHGFDGFYWYGSAANAYDARYHGWWAWLAKYHPEIERNPEGDNGSQEGLGNDQPR